MVGEAIGAATPALMAVMQSNEPTMKSHREMQNAVRP